MRPGGFELRKLVRSVLASPDFERTLMCLDVPFERIVNPLFCFLCETDELIRWRAVRGIGITVSAIVERNVEAARVIMRRLIWSLNDESGGIGWGSPEAMGEIMAESAVLAGEYHRILVSYIDEDGNPLENDELERGVMWAISRLAGKRPELLKESAGPVLKQISSPDPAKRGLALRTLVLLTEAGAIGIEPGRAVAALSSLLDDDARFRMFVDGAFVEYEIGRLARELARLLQSPEEGTIS